MGWGWSSQLFQSLVLFLCLISVCKSPANSCQMAERSSGGLRISGKALWAGNGGQTAPVLAGTRPFAMSPG